MKTYLTMWFNSEGANPTVIMEKLRNMGFKPLKGQYDHVYDWERDIDLEEILQVANSVHETLKGLKVVYKLESL